jgi:hypothetical protein
LDFYRLFRRIPAMKQFSGATKPFSAFAQTSGNGGWLSVWQRTRRATPIANTGDSQMRTLGFILVCAFVLAGPSMAGSPDRGLPGIGTFVYSGSPIPASAPQAMVVAAR